MGQRVRLPADIELEDRLAFGLTARQLNVLDLLVDGLSNAQIADRLVISRKTADHHVSAILAKLDAR